jgi:hypothetical protein
MARICPAFQILIPGTNRKSAVAKPEKFPFIIVFKGIVKHVFDGGPFPYFFVIFE